MPELGEVAHAAAILRKHILDKTLKHVSANHDDLLYVKPLNHEMFIKASEGSKVSKIARNGKNLMIELEAKRTLILHFGMTGWIHVRNAGTLIRMEGGGDKRQKELMQKLQAEGKDVSLACEFVKEWPPRFTKFTITTDTGDELAFVDPRRLGRVRLLNVPQCQAIEMEPLNRLGLDYSQVQPPTEDVLPLILKRRVPVKSLLLDQSLFSGIGNWMADEILHQARIHPQQYSDTLGRAHAARLYSCLLEVCRIAAETEGNSALFPRDWLMLHRWGKSRSKKEAQTTADGHLVSFVTVGGRTSCFVPELQKKFKPVEDEEEMTKEKLEVLEAIENAVALNSEGPQRKKIKKEKPDDSTPSLNGSDKIEI